MKMRKKGILYLTIALLTFGFSSITDKIGINAGVDPSVFSFFQTFFGLIFVGIIWFTFKKKEKLHFKKSYIKPLLILGVTASGLAVALSTYALEFTTATNKGIMQGLYTAATLVFAYFMLHERLPKLFYPVFIAMIFGLVLLTSNGFLELPNKGDWILFLTIPLIGFANVYAKKTMNNIHSFTVAFGRYVFGALFLLLLIPFFALEGFETLNNGLIWVVLSGLLASLKVITFYKGIEFEGPTIAALFLGVSPVVTAISDYYFLGTTFSPLQITGIILVLASALFVIKLKAAYVVDPTPTINLQT